MWKAEKQQNTNEFHTRVDQLERSKNAEDKINKHEKRIHLVRQLHKQSGTSKIIWRRAGPGKNLKDFEKHQKSEEAWSLDMSVKSEKS